MKNLLIEGYSGVGKTTLILESLGCLRTRAGGFVTVRMTDERGSTVGFAVEPFSDRTEAKRAFTGDMSCVFIYFADEVQVDIGKFAACAGRSLESADPEFFVMDEFGGVELKDEAFTEKVLEVLEHGRPVIGVIKSLANAEHAARGLAPDGEFMARYEKLRRYIETRTDTEILTLTDNNREDVSREIDCWMRTNNLKM